MRSPSCLIPDRASTILTPWNGHRISIFFSVCNRTTAGVYRASVLYTTLSPCAMCSGAILLYGIPKVVVGENRTFMGEEEWLRSRGVDVHVLQDARCIQLMADFIAEHPQLWHEDIGVQE